jgi:hypothetical protein
LNKEKKVKFLRSIGSVAAIYTLFTLNAHAATAHHDINLDLTDTQQHQVTINGVSRNIAGEIKPVSLGNGWDGEIDVQITSGDYNSSTTMLGFALTTDPNETLLNDLDSFKQLTAPGADIRQFFDDNVEGWVLYGWGTDYLPAGDTSNLTDQINPMQFDPNEDYYAFVAGVSLSPTTVSISFDISDGNGNAVTPIPLPAAVWFFGTGLLGLIGMRRRKVS